MIIVTLSAAKDPGPRAREILRCAQDERKDDSQ